MTESTLQSQRRQFAIEVVRKLREAGFEALWAGGCVRDLLLQRAPVDYDVATSAHPEQVRQLFGFRRTLAVGAAFGVIIVLGPDDQAGQIEVATFRNDAQYSDGRRPDAVTFSTAKQDAERRDFTINGMFFDPLNQQLIDYVGGADDLQRGLIRAIGHADSRIAEDKLRMLRAVRFAARFNFAIEAATEAALARHAAELRVVSGERMTAELSKTLVTPAREMALRTWASTGLMNVLLPQLAESWSQCAQAACSLAEAVEARQWCVVLAAALWPKLRDDPARLKSILNDFKVRLKFSNEDLAQIKVALAAQSILGSATTQPWSTVQPCLMESHIEGAVALLRARVAVGEVDAGELQQVQRGLALPPEQLNPPPLLDGARLQALGLQPGPKFKELLSAARTAQLDGWLRDRQQAIEWVKAQMADQ